MLSMLTRRMASYSSIQTALKTVNENIKNAISRRPRVSPNVRLVAVTKTKPVEDIIAAYNCGQRYFGENYINELEEKCRDQRIIESCRDIRWHFIGHLQSNKVNKLVAIPNLYMMETVHSANLASLLHKALKKSTRTERLKVMVQVNTSDEDSKNGLPMSEAADLVSLIIKELDTLQFAGLMTIGALDHSISDGVNPDFMKLIKCREEVCTKCNLKLEDVELSMGMSNDYEHAIELGSTNIRVGSTIFGARAPPSQTGQQSGQSQETQTDTSSKIDGTSTKKEDDRVLEQFQNVSLQ